MIQGILFQHFSGRHRKSPIIAHMDYSGFIYNSRALDGKKGYNFNYRSENTLQYTQLWLCSWERDVKFRQVIALGAISFVCLCVCQIDTGYNFTPICSIYHYWIRLWTSQKPIVLGQFRVKVKVKVTQNTENTFSAITREPYELETSGWTHIEANLEAQPLGHMRPSKGQWP